MNREQRRLIYINWEEGFSERTINKKIQALSIISNEDQVLKKSRNKVKRKKKNKKDNGKK